MKNETEELHRAFRLHQQGMLSDAASVYEKLAKKNPKNYDALHFLGVIKAAFGQHNEAKRLMERSLASKAVAYVENYVNLLAQLGEYGEAAKLCSKTIASTGRTESLSYVLAFSLYRLGRLEEAVNEFAGLLSSYPNHLAGNNEMAVALAQLRRYEEALRYLETALTINPHSAPAFLNKGNILFLLKRNDEALISYKRAISLDSKSCEAHLGLGNLYQQIQHYDEAFSAYDKALAIKLNLDGAWLGRGNLFLALKRYDEASAAYDRALASNPNSAEAWVGRGNFLTELSHYDDALAAYNKALSLMPDLASAWHGCADVFARLKRYDDAFDAFDKAFALQPDMEGLEARRFHFKMHLCNWNRLDDERRNLIESVKQDKLNADPLTFVGISTSPVDQLRCAKAWTTKKYAASNKPFWQGEIYRHDRIRIAYASADFRQHPVSHLTAGMFEAHDRTRFEVTALSFGPDDGSDMRRRLEASFDNFVDVRTLSADLLAEKIRKDEIDILIDLTGHTQHTRLDVFARRVAPIQATYLGFPGTIGADFMDYLIADRTLIAESHKSSYAEKIVYLPHTYQANDAKRVISNESYVRAQFGLPENGFVFCCFNNNYKVFPEVFDCWMRLLGQVNGSVLWLAEDNAVAPLNLRIEATARGIDAERLVFSKRMPSLADHLARHRLADLFLDTLPFNAHTTASDALWAGLPVLTQIGETFAGRVAASLLNAAGLPELIAQTRTQYEAMAIELATNPEKLNEMKRKLARNRLSTPLFDTQLFTRHMESAYEAMFKRYQSGLPPDHIVTPH